MKSSPESIMKKNLKLRVFQLGVVYSNMFQADVTIGRLESNISDEQRKFHYNVYKTNKTIFEEYQRHVFTIIDWLHQKNDKTKRELKSAIAFLNIMYSNKFESDLTFSRLVDPTETKIEFHKKLYVSQEKVYNEQYEEVKKLIDKL